MRKMSAPSACSVYSREGVTTRSGFPSFQPGVIFGAGGSAAGSPSGVPLFTHRSIRSISSSVSRGDPTKSPLPTGSGFQGGM